MDWWEFPFGFNGLNTHDDVFSKARGLNLGLSLHLQPVAVRASSKGSGESEHSCRLA